MATFAKTRNQLVRYYYPLCLSWWASKANTGFFLFLRVGGGILQIERERGDGK